MTSEVTGSRHRIVLWVWSLFKVTGSGDVMISQNITLSHQLYYSHVMGVAFAKEDEGLDINL